MQNIVILAGNIGQTPEVRTAQSGTKITVTMTASAGSFPNVGSFVKEQLIKSLEEQNARLKEILENQEDTTFE